MDLARDYSPKVINNITVGGVQQVLLKVKVMEISRTKLRRLGVDWAYLGGGGGFAGNSISEILSFYELGAVVNNNNNTFPSGSRPNSQTPPRFSPSRTSSRSAADPHNSTLAANSRLSFRRASAPARLSSRNSAPRSTSCRSCSATERSAWKCGRASALLIRPSALYFRVSKCPASRSVKS